MDLFRVFLIIILSFIIVKYQFQSVSNVLESLDHLYISFVEDKYSGTLSHIKDRIQENSLARNLHTFIINFDITYFLNKILMARIERQNQRHEISQKNNFASLYGGASIIEKNQGAINTKSILDDNTDKYMLNQCSTKNKYIVISLKEDININGFAIINTEFYSSNVKDIIVYGSNEYPIEMKEWVQLGEFRLENIYEWQQFPLKTMWARYVRIEFKSHYEEEYYCTITQIRVFGSPILADFKKDFVNQKREKKKIENLKFPINPPIAGTNSNLTEENQTSLSDNKNNQQSDGKLPQFTPIYDFYSNKTDWKAIQAQIQQIHSQRQCKNIDWKNLKELYECSEEEAKQQELEFEQSQSIFTILTMNINEIRQFIEQQVKSNLHFNQQIDGYKQQLSTCQTDKKSIIEMNKNQMDQIEDLRKMFYTVSIVVVIFCFVLLLLVCFKRKQTVGVDNGHQFGRR